MLSTVLELGGFVAALVGLFLLAGVGAALLGAGIVFMIVGYAVGEPE